MASKVLPQIQPKRLIRALERAGFILHRVTGSHYILKHPLQPTLRVTVPFHNRDLKRGTLQSIIKQAGFTNEEFLELL
jgi:predicted RNA binding protein YcfA (HicA-like mRNA interferase family)